jgi:5-bromo-4-chloroindolyl phosphate hydrolysis protein
VSRIAKLLTVKSIVTIILTGVFSHLAINQVISGEQFLTVFTVVVSFYFGTQLEKHGGE